MDGSRFDAWTRRHFGLAAGGLAVSLIGLGAVADAEAKKGKKKKKKRKKCRKLNQACTQGGKKKCCGKQGLSCQPKPFFEPDAGTLHCCRKGFEPCSSSSECCSRECLDGFCTCKTDGFPCGGFDAVCCSLNCVGEGDEASCQPA